MSVKRNEADRELALLVGAWEWWKDATVGRNVSISAQIERTGQKGVFSVTVAAVDVSRPQGVRTLAKVTRTYPNSGKGSFGDFFLGIVMSVGRIVDDTLLDAPGETRTPR